MTSTEAVKNMKDILELRIYLNVSLNPTTDYLRGGFNDTQSLHEGGDLNTKEALTLRKI